MSALLAATGSRADQSLGAPAAAAADGGRQLVVGRVTSNPRKDHPRLERLAGYLAGRLSDRGIVGSRIQFAKDDATMVTLLRNGEVDLVPDTIFPALTYADQAGARLLLREWRDGVPTYHAVLFARRDGGIAGPLDLRGKTIAFEDPGSTSGYFIPRAELEALGLRLVELSGRGEAPPPDAVGYVFARSENNIAVWVYEGRVQAGAFSNVDWDEDQDMPPALKGEFEIFHHTEPLPRAVILVRGDLPRGLREAIKRVLLAADEDPEGRAALKAYKDVTGYDELTGEAAAGVAAARRILETFR
ncbi:MAG TPA: phosphate/phosphite/phosphonate ABC transporter substrate-binding protein [Geminicoccaceae bacterium]|nr:phosphate/phosphite/phosphonate ABC transporter substrate-binding protein [Geminicoccaceae bacterium]